MEEALLGALYLTIRNLAVPCKSVRNKAAMTLMNMLYSYMQEVCLYWLTFMLYVYIHGVGFGVARP